tara:strand:- start:191 stop:2011 length:1821 start_codon:yes stop_codon:yes gene_type:complete
VVGGRIIVMKIITIIVISIHIILFSNFVYAKKDKIFLSDLDSFGEYFEIQEFPEGMFEGDNNKTLKQKGVTAGRKIGYYFITKKNSLEKYPQNMMKAMAYFEVYYLQTLKEKELSISRFKDQNYNSNDLSSLNTVLSLNKARKSMREAVGLSLEDTPEEAIKRFWLMNDYLSKGKIKTITIENNVLKKKKKTIDLKTNAKGLNNLVQKRIEKRIDTKEYKKQIKNYTRKIKKNVGQIQKIKTNEMSFTNYADESNIISSTQLSQNIAHIDDLLNKIYDNEETLLDNNKLEEITNLLNLVDYSLSKVLLYFPKKYVNDLSKVDLSIFDKEKLNTISDISQSSKINKKTKNQELQNTLFNLENYNFDTKKYINKLNIGGIKTNEVSVNLTTMAEMKNWSSEQWANSYNKEVPEQIMDSEGNIVETLSEINIQDLKAQLALNELKELGDTFENIADELNNSNLDIAETIQNSDFTVSLDKYDKFFMTFGYADFNEYVGAWNVGWEENYSREELIGLINEPQNLDLASAIDVVDTEGLGFDAGALAASVGMELADVATTVANAVASEVSVDLEAVSQGLGYSSFSDAVSAYNSQYGTNYTEEEAKEALGL